MAKHALLSASSAESWLNCTPSARLTEKYKDTSSEYAELGTLAHSFGELKLKKELKLISPSIYNKKLLALQGHELYYPDIEPEVEDYTNYVMEEYYAALAKTKDAKIFLEEKLDYSSYVPSGFGTGDCVIIADGELEIIDLKFGTGVPVSPINNSQLKLYALGAYEKYEFIYDIKKVKMTIAQVRLDNISSWEIDADMLEGWAETELRKKAALAYKGEGILFPGAWCGFCKAKATCKARTKESLEFYEANYSESPNLMSPTEIANVLNKADGIIKWANDVKEYAFDEALKGTKFPGWKLVEGRSNRQITDEDKLAVELMKAGFEEGKLYKPKTLEGITNLEKVVGKKKFGELSKDFITKPPGKPTLVDESDKRTEIDSVEDEFDFE